MAWMKQSLALRHLVPARIVTTKPVALPHVPRRSGISLLEILISIGVVGIGLLGVASLIPLAHYKATEGVREERKALFGKRAFRDFTVYGFDNPGRVNLTPTTVGSIVPTYRASWNRSLPTSLVNTLFSNVDGRLVNQTFLFDPHGVAASRDAAGAGGLRTAHAFNFPDNHFYAPGSAVGAEIQIPRVELRVRADAYLQSQLLNDPSATTAANAIGVANVLYQQLPMGSAEADEIFRMRDDLIVPDVEDTPDTVRTNAYLRDNNGIRTKMMTSGSFSWMATLVPELKFNVDVPTILAEPTNRYLMSLVVFNKRDLTGSFREEVVAQVTGGLMAGSTKELFIREIDAENTTQQNVGVRDIRAGDWIALYQKRPLFPNSGNVDPHLKTLKWYRVTSADEVTPTSEEVNSSDRLTNGIDPTRELSLSGPDWTPINDPRLPVYAIYLRNVVSVYEKTVELKR